MTALTFGSREAPLFGVYHPAAGPARPRRAVLLCNPFGEEAIRAFRPFQQLAARLAENSVPCLRFDYLGTGNSGGEDDLVSLASMAESIVLADEELRDMSSAREVVWVSLRLGAWAALLAANEAAPDELIFWEPVADGEAFLTELADLSGSEAEALGFPIPDALRDELIAGIPSVPQGPNIRVIGEAGFAGSDATAPADRDVWNSDEALNSFRVPGATLDQIVEAVTA